MPLFESTNRSLYQDCLDERQVFWVTDPGHGWLAVPLTLVDSLGFGPRISPYSYVGSDQHGYSGFAMLEEDCDAALYFEAAGKCIGHECSVPEFTFGQPSGSVAHDVRALNSYATRKVTA